MIEIEESETRIVFKAQKYEEIYVHHENLEYAGIMPSNTFRPNDVRMIVHKASLNFDQRATVQRMIDELREEEHAP